MSCNNSNRVVISSYCMTRKVCTFKVIPMMSRTSQSTFTNFSKDDNNYKLNYLNISPKSIQNCAFIDIYFKKNIYKSRAATDFC